MPIAPRLLQKRLSQVGVIRLGERRMSQNNKPYPAKLETFRITSPSEQLVRAVAALLGGTPKPWRGNAGPEWEVITNATEIAVLVPPQRIDPNFELWGNGYRARMCDGDTERLRGVPCLCEAAARARYQQTGQPWPEDGRFERTKNDCKPTTRMSLMIADIPSGVGTFKLESHGWNAAAELPTLAQAIASAPAPISATLRLEQRESGRLVVKNGQEKVDPRKYAVPVLDFFGLFTPRQAFSGQLQGAVVQALAGAERRALESGPDWAGEIAAAADVAALDALAARMKAAGVGDEALRQAWTARHRELAQTRGGQDNRKPSAKQAPAAVTAPIDEPVDAEIVDETDTDEARDAAWAQIMREAGRRGWSLPDTEDRYRRRMGHDPSDDAATAARLGGFLAAVKAGEVR